MHGQYRIVLQTIIAGNNLFKHQIKFNCYHVKKKEFMGCIFSIYNFIRIVITGVDMY